MTHDPHDERPTAGPTPLDYGRPPSRLRFVLQTAIGGVVACAAVLVSALAAFDKGLRNMIGLPLLVAIGFVVAAMLLRRGEHTRGWAAGFLIGTAAAVLIDGICWVSVAYASGG